MTANIEDWQQQAATALLRGEDLTEVVHTLTTQGIAETEAAAACARTFVDPVFAAARPTVQLGAKLESILAIRSSLLDLAGAQLAVPRRAGLRRQDFLDQHYAANRPVILTDICNEWPALTTWTPDYLAKVLKGQSVEVVSGRDADANYELNSDEHKQQMQFEDFIAVLTGPASNDTYLVANNKLLDLPAAVPLWSDFALDPRFMRTDTALSRTFLWLGPAGTVTPLHHDVMNVMFHQVAGSKRVTLISPLETAFLYNETAVYSQVDPAAPDLERFPSYSDAHPVTVRLGPGDALFIPVGWWHRVESLDMSASVSSTSFVWPNEYDWFYPEPIR